MKTSSGLTTDSGKTACEFSGSDYLKILLVGYLFTIMAFQSHPFPVLCDFLDVCSCWYGQ